MPRPEEKARTEIDAALTAAGWTLQDRNAVNLYAAQGVAVREFPLTTGHADYLLFVDGKAAGVVEAKKEGMTLTGAEPQTRKYSAGLPGHLRPAWDPLPFLYRSNGGETFFTNLLEPEPRSRPLFDGNFHRPETLAAWLSPSPELPNGHPLHGRPAPLRARLHHLPELAAEGLWPAQHQAVLNLEESLQDNRPRSLIQMATGSGKTFTAITAAYRLIKFAGARRILFLVDRSNLGRQALKEFQQYVTPDDGRKFTDLYNVQHLTSNKLDSVSRVVICTIQRLYSILKGEEIVPNLAELEERSLYSLEGIVREPVPVVYNPRLPLETFDVVMVDECHRSIYTLWRQVVEYFDAFLIGLTATPSPQTIGFFGKNLVMEYGHAQAVADKVNVDYTVYRIRTRITEQGSSIEAGSFVDYRDRRTRAVRWEELDDDVTYAPQVLDRVASIPIALPPLAEQARIVAEVERRISFADEILAVVIANLLRSRSLRQAILRKAFEGHLVPQDPNDEPASVLLERIRQARDSQSPETRPKKERPKTAPAAPTPAPLPARAEKPAPAVEPATEPQGLDFLGFSRDEQIEVVWETLLGQGALEKDEAIRAAAEGLRDQGFAQFKRLRQDGPLYGAIAAAIERGVREGCFDRPRRGSVRAVLGDPKEYTIEDWQRCLLAVVNTEPIDIDAALHAAAEWAREAMGLEYVRLREDGVILTGLRASLEEAVRKRQIVRKGERVRPG